MHIAILLATYNGNPFIAEQLQSIADQTHEDWSLWVSDDGSTDDTLDVVAQFAQRHGHDRVHVMQGPGKGGIRNFASLLMQKNLDGDYYAFCDQDDVWLPHKLERSLSLIEPLGQEQAVLTGNRTIVTDKDLNRVGVSRLFPHPPCFANALVQSIAGGNTMVFNRAALALARSVVEQVRDDIVSHDWWMYQLVTGCGGTMIYDAEPTLLYRQHGDNLIGANIGSRASAARLIAGMRNRFSEFNERNVRSMTVARPHFLPENQALLDEFIDLRKRKGPGAVLALRKAGFFRQTARGMAALHIAAFLGKV